MNNWNLRREIRIWQAILQRIRQTQQPSLIPVLVKAKTGPQGGKR